MDCFKRFSTLGRILATRSRNVPEIYHGKKYSQTYCALANNSNLIRKPKKLENSFPLFKYHERQPVTNLGRCFSDTSKENRHLIQTFSLYFNPFPMFEVMICRFKAFLIRMLIDNNFKTQEFLESAEVALKIVSKLISESKLDELEGLVTPECISKLKETFDNWVPMDRGDLEISESDFITTTMYNLEGIAEENRRGIQVSLFYFVIKGIGNDVGDPMKAPNMQEFFKKIQEVMSKKEANTYGANYRFIKWLDNDRPNDWIINGINHFKIAKQNKLPLF